MVEEIIILTESPFSKRDYDRFGIEILSRDFMVRVLDCTPWLKPDFWRTYSNIRYEFSGYCAIGNWQDFEARMRSMISAIVIDYLGSCPTTEKIRKVLRQKKTKRAIVHNGLYPQARLGGYERFLNRLRQGRLIRRGLNKLWRGIRLVISSKYLPDIAVLSGEVGLKDYRAKAHHRIWAHHFNYDIFLAINKRPKIKMAPYAVFLDEDMVYHSDYLHHGLNPVTSEKNYYTALNRFLYAFENRTGLSVAVAAHPRSRYDLRPNLFAGRVAVLGKTAELVRNASLVFGHTSDSQTFAVLWRKPIVLLTTNDLQKSFKQPYIDAKSELFDAPLINMDSFDLSNLDLQKLSHVNQQKYEDYKRLYIKKPATPELPVWEIFAAYLRDNRGSFFT